MRHHVLRMRTGLAGQIAVAALTLSLCIQPAMGQQPDPLAAPAAAEPAPMPTDPAAQALLETNPTTPRERLDAILLLIRLDETAAARPLAAGVLADNLDDAAWSALVNELGVAAFVKLGLEPELQPEGKRLADAALTAAERVARDPARLAEFVVELSDSSPAIRQTAVAQLRRAGAAAVAPLVAALADPARSDEHAVVRAMLATLGSVGHDALIPALESGSPLLQSQVAGVLGRTGAAAALPALLSAALEPDTDASYQQAARLAVQRLAGRVPNRQQAAEFILRRALESYEGRAPLDIDADNQAQLWRWDAELGASQQVTLPVPIARRARAVELAGRALRLDPNLAAARNLERAATLELAAISAGLDNPLPIDPDTIGGQLSQLDRRELSALLADCLTQRRTVAAAALAEILGASGDASLLYPAGVQPTPLVRAAAADDRRVRFAALGAIIRLKPTRPFSGSSQVPRGLEYFIGAVGTRAGVAAAPHLAEATRLGSLLAQGGIEPHVATDARGMFQLASQMLDCEVVLLDALIPPSGAFDALAELRRDPRTARLPVAVVAGPEHEELARDIARHDPLAAAWIRPMHAEGVAFQLQQLEEQALSQGVEAGSPELRTRQAALALDWLEQLLGLRPELFDLRPLTSAVERALHVPELTDRATRVLSKLPSPQAQRALAELASQEISSAATRTAAAAGFAESVSRYGCLLTTVEMQRQYDRYNDSEFKAEFEQQLLGSLLDAIEAGRTRAGDDAGAAARPQPPATPTPPPGP